MTTPDTTEDGLTLDHKEALFEVLTPWVRDQPYPDNAIQELFEDLAGPIAAIRRQAAADALKTEARGLDRLGAFYSRQKLALLGRSDTRSAETYAVHAAQAHADANRLHRAAADKIAEGYEYECAAFNQECETRVPDAGDFCSKHEPEDDEDPRWAE